MSDIKQYEKDLCKFFRERHYGPIPQFMARFAGNSKGLQPVESAPIQQVDSVPFQEQLVNLLHTIGVTVDDIANIHIVLEEAIGKVNEIKHERDEYRDCYNDIVKTL